MNWTNDSFLSLCFGGPFWPFLDAWETGITVYFDRKTGDGRGTRPKFCLRIGQLRSICCLGNSISTAFFLAIECVSLAVLCSLFLVSAELRCLSPSWIDCLYPIFWFINIHRCKISQVFPLRPPPDTPFSGGSLSAVHYGLSISSDQIS